MNIWIVGKNGLVARALQEYLEEQEIPFIATSREEVDITRLDQLHHFLDLHPLTHIVNCAAYTHVDGAESDAENAFAVNVQGPENLGMIARNKNLSVLHLSTDYVFDGKKTTAYVESDACSPLNIYGNTKWLGEQKLLKQLPSACILRTSWVFGKGGQNLISLLPRLLMEKEELKIVADQMSSPTYAGDLVQSIVKLLNQSGVFHFANAGECSRMEIADFVKKEAVRRGVLLQCRTLIPIQAQESGLVATRPSYSVLASHPFLGQSRTWQEAMKEYLDATL